MIKRIENPREKNKQKRNKQLLQELEQSNTVEQVKEVIRKMLAGGQNDGTGISL